MTVINLALISGGISSEREVSLNSGKQVYQALDKEKYRIFQYDPKTDIEQLVKDAFKLDAALIILHGLYGEDGTIQGLLDLLNIPYQGSGVLGSAIAMDKLVSKQLYEKSGIPVPPFTVVAKEDDFNLADISERLGLPLVVKPIKGGSSIGMSIAASIEDLDKGIQKAFEYDQSIIIEKYIKGVEITGGIIGNKELTALPLIEIIPNEGYAFFDYDAKYKKGASREICPARISDVLTDKAQMYSKMAHSALFCEGYSRTDMIVENDTIYVLETNTIPGMTATSLLPQAAQKAGFSFSQLLDKLIELSLENHKLKKLIK